MDEKVQISTNWCLLRGKNIAESLVIKTSEKNEILQEERPSIDDIVSFEQSIHLQQPQDNESNDEFNFQKKSDCEIYFKILLDHTPNILTLVTDCQKIEVFVDIHREYYNTYIGEFLDDFDGMRVYRFDIDITKRISHFLIRLIPRVPEIWIYGIQLDITNTQRVGMDSPLHNINMENVKSILSGSSHKLTPKAEECKSFVENFLQGNGARSNLSNLDSRNELTKWPTELEHLKVLLNNTKKLSLNGNNNEDNYSHKVDELKTYIDKTVLDMENRIILQMQDLEKRQNEKLDKIIEILTLSQKNQNYL